jgi:uncharacterized membrane protein
MSLITIYFLIALIIFIILLPICLFSIDVIYLDDLIQITGCVIGISLLWIIMVPFSIIMIIWYFYNSPDVFRKRPT